MIFVQTKGNSYLLSYLILINDNIFMKNILLTHFLNAFKLKYWLYYTNSNYLHQWEIKNVPFMGVPNLISPIIADFIQILSTHHLQEMWKEWKRWLKTNVDKGLFSNEDEAFQFVANNGRFQPQLTSPFGIASSSSDLISNHDNKNDEIMSENSDRDGLFYKIIVKFLKK